MRLIDADALLQQIGIDAVDVGPGQYGDEWRFMGTIDKAPTLMTREEYDVAKKMLALLYKKMDEGMINDETD